jgi:hypothetical protein
MPKGKVTGNINMLTIVPKEKVFFVVKKFFFKAIINHF